MISESASEKPRRGRPPALDPAWVREMQAMFPEIRTTRGLMNRCYAIRALGVLDCAEAFRWFLPSKEDVMAGVADLPYELLTELGRIGDEERMHAAAAAVCEHRLKGKAAVAGVRRARMGRVSAGSELALANTVITCINAYLKRIRG